jgi:hypothetical protein
MELCTYRGMKAAASNIDMQNNIGNNTKGLEIMASVGDEGRNP